MKVYDLVALPNIVATGYWPLKYLSVKYYIVNVEFLIRKRFKPGGERAPICNKRRERTNSIVN